MKIHLEEEKQGTVGWSSIVEPPTNVESSSMGDLLTIRSVSSRMRFCRMLSTVCSETGCCQLKLNFPPRAGGSLGNPILWALSYVHKRRQTQTMSPRNGSTAFTSPALQIALSYDGKDDNFVVARFPRVVVKKPIFCRERVRNIVCS